MSVIYIFSLVQQKTKRKNVMSAPEYIMLPSKEIPQEVDDDILSGF